MTDREAVPECFVRLRPETCERLLAGTTKGTPLEAAHIAGLMAMKRTAELLPFCHPVALTGADITVEAQPARGRVTIRATVRASDCTGVEIEALTACAIAAMTVYDAANAFERGAVIEQLRLVEKRGGRSDDFHRGG